ncbi:MAG: hypothetical protein ACJ0BN_12850, partial [Limisphaerales bacterium]
QGVFGTTEFGVADNLFTAVEGGSVNSVFDAPVHVVIVSDTAAGESHLYIDGALSGTWAGNIPFSGDTKVMGARLEQATDHMGEGSVMHSWATYSGLLTAAEIAPVSSKPFPMSPLVVVTEKLTYSTDWWLSGTLTMALSMTPLADLTVKSVVQPPSVSPMVLADMAVL